MPPRNPDVVQLDFPQLTADLIAELRLQGTLGLLDFLTAVRPVYIVASRAGALAVSAVLPAFGSAEITNGDANNPAANTIIGDTGALPAGDYDIFASISVASVVGAPASTAVFLQHRNAANTVTLATLLHGTSIGAVNIGMFAQLPLTGYTIGLNERLRWILLVSNIIGHVGTVIGARLRPTP